MVLKVKICSNKIVVFIDIINISEVPTASIIRATHRPDESQSPESQKTVIFI
jgi:hypothetical protein